MAAIIGIDLGTTFSAVAHLNESGIPAIIMTGSSDKNILPSCILFDDGVAVVGEEAQKAMWANDPSAIGRFKREMGTDKTYSISGQSFTPADLSGIILKKLAGDATAKLGEISEAVITVPACFGHPGREATMKAAEYAGLKVQNIIDEPTAAALYYGYKEGEDLGGTYAVYDLGGGTFDVSIIRVSGQDVEVLSSSGVAKLGGHDFDLMLQMLVFDKYKEETGETLINEDWSLGEAESTKRSLSTREEVKIRINRKLIKVTRGEFEEAISTLIAQTDMLCESALDEAEVTKSQLQGLFLAGGSTRVPAIHQAASRAFDLEPIASANVDEVVALGAALYAAYKGDRKALSPLQKASVAKIEFTEATHKHYGTIALGYEAEREEVRPENSIVIPRGTPIPCSIIHKYSTVRDGQTSVNCTVTECSFPETDPSFVDIIWSGELAVPGGRPAGQTIEVTFSYSDNKTMDCSFKDTESGRETTVNLNEELSKKDEGGGSSPISKFEVE